MHLTRDGMIAPVNGLPTYASASDACNSTVTTQNAAIAKEKSKRWRQGFKRWSSDIYGRMTPLFKAAAVGAPSFGPEFRGGVRGDCLEDGADEGASPTPAPGPAGRTWPQMTLRARHLRQPRGWPARRVLGVPLRVSLHGRRRRVERRVRGALSSLPLERLERVFGQAQMLL